MKSYTFVFHWNPLKDTVLGEKLHDSYLEQIRLQTVAPLEQALRKKGYPADTYSCRVSTSYAFYGEFIPLFSLSITVHDPSFEENIRFIGGARIFYRENTDAHWHPTGKYPVIDPKADISTHEPVMTCKVELMDTVAQLKAKMEMSKEQFMRRLEKTISVPVELRSKWPDVLFDFHFLENPDCNASAEVLSVFMQKYNKRHPEEPIHYVGEPQKRGRRVRVHVDFGGCEPTALIATLKAIGKAKLPLEKLVLR